MTDRVPIKRALISVSDKNGLIDFAAALADAGATIVSTGGTAKALRDAGIEVIPIEQVTGFPEMLNGRVKTLHPNVHGGLLALRDAPEHTAALTEHGIEPIDLVCVNLYPFEKTVAEPATTPDQGIEQIDIGGPSMIRSAAKNHRSVAVVTDPAQYPRVLDDIAANDGATSLGLRRELAAQAFNRTAAYDTAIGRWLTGQDQPLPNQLNITAPLAATLRYGENPHQAAALYANPTATNEPSVAAARQLHGKELSFNNLNDAAAALEVVKEFAPQPAAAVIKHANPCGCALGDNLAEAFERAYAGDPLAAFGGIVALSRPVDTPTAEALIGPGPGGNPKFLEVIIAPEYHPDALEKLKERWKNVRLLAVGDLRDPAARDTALLDVRGFVGGFLAQQRDLADTTPTGWQHVAGPPLTDDDNLRRTMHVAWCAVKHVKSNAIVIANDQAVVGVGAGQMDRVQSCRIAANKAAAQGNNRAQGGVAGSDAFFPFRDGPDVLMDAGVTVIVQPGGSKRDQDTIDACNERGVTLFFTGRRHFRH